MNSINTDPYQLFPEWVVVVNKAGFLLSEAMSISSCGSDGQPSSRMVLLKAFDKQGFVFYSNYSSRKGQGIFDNQKVAILFHRPVLQRQIRIEGKVEVVSYEPSATYFNTVTALIQ